jgi:hypothetical protein
MPAAHKAVPNNRSPQDLVAHVKRLIANSAIMSSILRMKENPSMTVGNTQYPANQKFLQSKLMPRTKYRKGTVVQNPLLCLYARYRHKGSENYTTIDTQIQRVVRTTLL